jgi:hypothetical protein
MKYFLIAYIFVSFSIILSAQTTIKLNVSRDVALGYHDNYNTANRNYASAIQNASYYIPGFIGGINCNRALIDFDLSSVPKGAKIVEAKLSLFAFKNYPEGTLVANGHFGENASYLRRVVSTWNEYTATWNNQPITTTENQVVLPKSNHATEDYLNIDVTALVIDMIEKPTESHGLMLGLIQEEEYANLSFHSNDGPDSSKHPVLQIVFQINVVFPTDPSKPVEPRKPVEPDQSNTSDQEEIGSVPQLPTTPNDSSDFNFKIYPNPGRKVLKIEFNDDESKHIKMYTMEGKIIFSQDSNELIHEIVVWELAPAIYYIQCSNGNKTITRKYVKMVR